MVNVETELEKINNPIEEAASDGVIKPYPIQLLTPATGFGEKLILTGLSMAALGASGLFLIPFWKLCEQYPILILPTGGAVAIYLAGGYEEWRAKHHIAP